MKKIFLLTIISLSFSVQAMEVALHDEANQRKQSSFCKCDSPLTHPLLKVSQRTYPMLRGAFYLSTKNVRIEMDSMTEFISRLKELKAGKRTCFKVEELPAIGMTSTKDRKRDMRRKAISYLFRYKLSFTKPSLRIKPLDRHRKKQLYGDLFDLLKKSCFRVETAEQHFSRLAQILSEGGECYKPGMLAASRKKERARKAHKKSSSRKHSIAQNSDDVDKPVHPRKAEKTVSDKNADEDVSSGSPLKLGRKTRKKRPLTQRT